MGGTDPPYHLCMAEGFSKDATTSAGQTRVPKGATPAEGSAQPFDLNIERVLEHWPVSFALREFIANALDEQLITGTSDPQITKAAKGVWHIRDFGRGVSYEHLTQKENPEKLEHPGVIGQFGIGLKDALAVCDRHNIGVAIRSRHGDISTAQLPKAGFSDVVTLHGVVSPPSDADLVGTELIVSGIADTDVETAKAFFMRYSDAHALESTRYGDVVEGTDSKSTGRIYVKGLLVAEEPNFLFSYNVTNMNAALRRALNRERTNVGRGAYSDRIKDILKECRSARVAGRLAEDLARFTSGRMHDELNWKDVAVHACRVLQSSEKVVFVTVAQVGLASVAHAVEDGYRVVVVPEDIARALADLTDLDGRAMFDLAAFQREWNDSFIYRFVEPIHLTAAERAVLELTGAAAQLAGVDLAKRGIRVAISETTRLSDRGGQVLGVWEPAESRIVVRRDQLADAARYCGTLLHELTHAVSGMPDLSFEFEDALTMAMGTVAGTALGAPGTARAAATN